jgi:toprim domain protein
MGVGGAAMALEPLPPPDADRWVVIVEGQNDRRRLHRLLGDDALILLTYGIPSSRWLDRLVQQVGSRPVAIFTDADRTGQRIRGILSDVFPHAIHLHTKPSYRGVEHTPLDYLSTRLERAGLLPPRPDDPA